MPRTIELSLLKKDENGNVLGRVNSVHTSAKQAHNEAMKHKHIRAQAYAPTK